jgi:hypothetical protein
VSFAVHLASSHCRAWFAAPFLPQINTLSLSAIISTRRPSTDFSPLTVFQHTCVIPAPRLIPPEAPGELLLTTQATAKIGGATEDSFNLLLAGIIAIGDAWGLDTSDTYLTPVWRALVINDNTHLCLTPPTTELALLAARLRVRIPNSLDPATPMHVHVILLYEFNTRVYRGNKPQLALTTSLFPQLFGSSLFSQPAAAASRFSPQPLRPMRIEEVTDWDVSPRHSGSESRGRELFPFPATSHKRPRDEVDGVASTADSTGLSKLRALNLESQVLHAIYPLQRFFPQNVDLRLLLNATSVSIAVHTALWARYPLVHLAFPLHSPPFHAASAHISLLTTPQSLAQSQNRSLTKSDFSALSFRPPRGATRSHPQTLKQGSAWTRPLSSSQFEASFQWHLWPHSLSLTTVSVPGIKSKLPSLLPRSERIAIAYYRVPWPSVLPWLWSTFSVSITRTLLAPACPQPLSRLAALTFLAFTSPPHVGILHPHMPSPCALPPSSDVVLLPYPGAAVAGLSLNCWRALFCVILEPDLHYLRVLSAQQSPSSCINQFMWSASLASGRTDFCQVSSHPTSLCNAQCLAQASPCFLPLLSVLLDSLAILLPFTASPTCAHIPHACLAAAAVTSPLSRRWPAPHTFNLPNLHFPLQPSFVKRTCLLTMYAHLLSNVGMYTWYRPYTLFTAILIIITHAAWHLHALVLHNIWSIATYLMFQNPYKRHRLSAHIAIVFANHINNSHGRTTFIVYTGFCFPAIILHCIMPYFHFTEFPC